MKKIYICRDDRTEMLSAIYDAWKENRNKEVGIGLLGKTQQQLFCDCLLYTSPSPRDA